LIRRRRIELSNSVDLKNKKDGAKRPPQFDIRHSSFNIVLLK
jgi:hypothetical protein